MWYFQLRNIGIEVVGSEVENEDQWEEEDCLRFGGSLES
jgi:hypothetical protein